MLRRFLALIGAFAVVCLIGSTPAYAQNGYLPVTQHNLLDSNGARISNATACAQIMLGGHPASVQVGGNFVTTFTKVCANVVNGQWFMNLPDMSIAVPQYACVDLEVTDNLSGNALLSGYSCIQPRSVPPKNITGSFWCNASTCTLDSLPPYYPASDAFFAPKGDTGAQGATGCIVGQTCTTALTPKSVNGIVYAAGYGALCNGTDDTAALQAAIAAAKAANAGGTLNSLVLPPGTCRIAQTLDVSGLTVIGSSATIGGGNGTESDTILAPTTGNPGRDMLQTKGGTAIHKLHITGGWDHSTQGLAGNGISVLSSPGATPSYLGYHVILDDVLIDFVDHDGLYVNQPAYQSYHNLDIQAVGGNDVEAVSGTYPGFQTTTVSFTGTNVLDDAPYGYSLTCQSCISVSTSGGVVTAESTKGVQITGDGRELNLSNWYFENTIGNVCFTTAGSTGIGIVLQNDFGPGCGGPTDDSLAGWRNIVTGANDMGDVAGSSVINTTLRSQYGFSDPIVSNSGDFLLSSTPVSLIPTQTFAAGTAWVAIFRGTAVDFSGHTQSAALTIVSKANPTVGFNSGSATFSMSSGGKFQATGNVRLLGTIEVYPDRNTGGTYYGLQSAAPIYVNGVTSGAGVSGTTVSASGAVSGATVSASGAVSGGSYSVGGTPGFSGQCTSPHVPVFTGGIVTGCSTTP